MGLAVADRQDFETHGVEKIRKFSKKPVEKACQYKFKTQKSELAEV